jgi:hypothetical protein
MPITRTAMIDDDGSGTTGTILNNAWKQELYGQIDAAFAAPPPIGLVRYAGYAQVDGLSGNYDNYAMPNGPANPVWLFNPAAAVSFTGFVLEPHLTSHLLVNMTTWPILFYNFVQSSPPNRVICPGYANYTLGTWGSIWMTYFGNLGGWLLHKAT